VVGVGCAAGVGTVEGVLAVEAMQGGGFAAFCAEEWGELGGGHC